VRSLFHLHGNIAILAMASSGPQHYEEYTVGWICALPLEFAASRAALDECYGKPATQDSSDKNTYELGHLGEHKVVIACLPKGVYGTTSAATVAARMLSSFKSIRFSLMVGIGGGIPSRKHDIRLGDVVVSSPVSTYGGVVQYDCGKSIASGKFERTGALNKPPEILLTAISSLEAEQEMGNSRIPDVLAGMLSKHPLMVDTYSHPGQENEQLFRAEYTHIDTDDDEESDDCELCDATQVVTRKSTRKNSNPVVHYDIIASAN
jgi:Phosphorylase superfamily